MNLSKKEESTIIEFLNESNKIEGVFGLAPLIDAFSAFDLLLTEGVTEASVLDAHRIMIGRLNAPIAGNWRDCDVSVGGRVCPSPIKSYAMIKSLLEDVIPTTPKSIKHWHINFQHIHPFEDGNGRIGRMILNYHRIKANLPILIVHLGTEQRKYYEWFSPPPSLKGSLSE